MKNVLWAVPVGVAPPIPVGTNDAINVALGDGTGGTGVDEITVTDKTLIEIKDLKIEPDAQGTKWLLVTCRVKEKAPL